LRPGPGIGATSSGDRVMSDIMTKSMARNVFYGGSIFFILIFLALTVHSHIYARTKAVVIFRRRLHITSEVLST
jgi:hypothetical protein